jgi:hypothetical protein
MQFVIWGMTLRVNKSPNPDKNRDGSPHHQNTKSAHSSWEMQFVIGGLTLSAIKSSNHQITTSFLPASYLHTHWASFQIAFEIPL